MAALTIAVAMLGYGAAKSFRYYVKCQRNGLLEQPAYLGRNIKHFDIFYLFLIKCILEEKAKKENEEENNIKETKNKCERPRSNKTQARYRYKKGKM